MLGVFGLSIRTQERDLDEEFSRFGRVEKVTIVYDQRVSDLAVAPRKQLLKNLILVRSLSGVWFHKNGDR